MISFAALVVCGNGEGLVGFGRGKSAELGAAVDKVRRPPLSPWPWHFHLHFLGLSVCRYTPQASLTRVPLYAAPIIHFMLDDTL